MLIIFVFVGQGQEVLRKMADGRVSIIVAVFISTWACATSCWYWARVLLYFDLFGLPRNDRFKFYATWLPRVVGYCVFVIVSFALIVAAEPFRELGSVKEASNLSMYSVIWGLNAFIFLLFVTIRRKLFNLSDPIQPNLIKANDLPRSTKEIVRALSVLSIILVIGFRFSYLFLGQFLNTGAIVLLAGCAWVTFGSWLTYIGHKTRLPVFSFLIAVALISGYFIDYHPIRALDENCPPELCTLAEKFDSWSNHHGTNVNKPYPVVLVAAEGGGIRAAYWTASVLCALEDSLPDFSAHVFALSGVSGGSLGEAVFASLIAEERRLPSLRGHLREQAQKILSEDFLAPTLGVMLFPEVVQPLIGFNVIRADRSVALEDAWGAAWKKYMNVAQMDSDRFEKPFCDLWKDYPDDVPSLFLNGTSVEGGNRMIMSNVKIGSQLFYDALDIHAIMKRDTRLSTAVLMSARFAFVSPAGLLSDSRNRPWGHIVDGGYFDNSGAETVHDILTALADKLADTTRYRIAVIVISNEPIDSSSKVTVDSSPETTNGFLQVFAPIRAFLTTRVAHSRYSIAALSDSLIKRGGKFDHYNLIKRGVPIPLGWQLSESSISEMNRQLIQQLGEMMSKPPLTEQKKAP
jgi:hypothetical protein